MDPENLKHDFVSRLRNFDWDALFNLATKDPLTVGGIRGFLSWFGDGWH